MTNSALQVCMVWICAGCLLLAACARKNAHPPAMPVGGGVQHVYIAGDNGVNPVLWIDDDTVEVLSPTRGSATQVVKSDSDVYVAGVCNEGLAPPVTGFLGQFAYWKNGRQVNIGNTTLFGLSASIAIVGSNLYFSNGLYWINDVPTPLPDGGGVSFVREVFAAGGNIYAVGSDNSGNPVYWRNGQRIIITESNQTSSYPAAYSIYVSGNDVYIGGIDNFGKVAYWKNGVLNELQTADTTIYVSSGGAIFVSGNDVYVVGNYYSPANPSYLQPAYWKNGVQVNVPLNGALSGQANDIFVADTTVYVVGFTTDGAVYWQNGVEYVLNPQGSANSIIVQ